MLLGATTSGVILVAAWVGAPTAYGVLQGALREFSEVAREVLRPGDPVVVYGLNAPSVVFYTQHRVISLGPASAEERDRLRRLVDTERRVVVVTRRTHAPRLDGVPGLRHWKARGGYVMYVSSPQGEREPVSTGSTRSRLPAPFG